MITRRLINRIITSCFIVTVFLITLGFASRKQAVMPCSGVIIIVKDTLGTGFVDISDVKQIIQNKFGMLEGKPVASINISLLEKIINTNPFISTAEVFSTVDGKINIEVKQRIPVLRVINNKNESFYIDNDGVYMPLSEKYTARVPVANGNIFECEAGKSISAHNVDIQIDTTSTIMQQLYNIIGFTRQNEFWNDEVQQLYVNPDGDIELIPRVGNHSVILGDDKNLKDKFDKLFAFYREGLNKQGWDKYRTINLKYKDQVVCTKK